MIIITGLGRTGTSFTAKVLCEAGADFKGDWYDEDIKAGMEYRKVADINNLLRTGDALSLDEAIDKLGVPEIKSELTDGVVVKDPRFMLTLDLWLAAGIKVEHIVYCSRDYKEIYDSSMKSGRGTIGNINGMYTFYGAKVYFTFLERMFLKQTAASNIPVTKIYFPKSAKDFTEMEKLSFIAGRERLREAWEKSKNPDKISSKSAHVSEADVNPDLNQAYADLTRKDNEIKELSLKEATLLARVAELEEKLAKYNLPKRLERTFRKKLIYPFKKEIYSRYQENFYPKILANSIPKSGTHLLSGIFMTMGFKNKNAENSGIDYRRMPLDEILQKITFLKKGECQYGHMRFNEDFNNSLKNNKISHFLIVRDPRDVVVSLAFYIPKHPEHKLFPYVNDMSQRERLILSIEGMPGIFERMAETYESYLPWLDDNNCLLIKFEDLVGSHGGGSDKKQLEILNQIAKHSGMSMKESKIKKIADQTFNEKSATFRKGCIGDWVNWLDDEMLSILKKDEHIFKKFGYSI